MSGKGAGVGQAAWTAAVTVAGISSVGAAVGKAASTVAATMAEISGVGSGWAVWHPTRIPKVKNNPTGPTSLIAYLPVNWAFEQRPSD